MIKEIDRTSLYTAALVHSISWKESHCCFCSSDFIEAHTPERQQEYLKRKMNAGSRIFLLVVEEPVGIVSVTGNLIEDLYILPDQQNMGYGTRLLKFAVGECRGAPTLWILENNDKARRLYQKMGFKETGRIRACPSGLNEIELSMV